MSGDGTTILGRRPQTLLDAGHDQPARRDSASVHGLCGSDQPARRDSWSRCGPRGSNSRPGGTQPAGAVHGVQPVGQAGNSLRTLGCGAQTVSSAVLSLRALGSGGRPACPAGLSLQERCFTSLPGGTEPPGAARGGRPAGPSVHIVQERATVLDQPGRRDLASVHGVCGFDQTAWRNSSSPSGPRCSTSPARGTQPPCAGRRCRPAGTAGLSLRALGSVVGLAVQVGLSLRSGPRGSTSRPGATRPPGVGLHQPARRDSAAVHEVCGFDQPAPRDRLRERSTEVDQPSRRERASGRWAAGLCQLEGTQPAGARLRWSTCPPCGTKPPCKRSVGSTSQPGGTHRPRAGRRLDQPGQGDSASVHGVCGFDQTAWRNSSSPRGPPCSTSPARGTQPPCAGRPCRPAGTAGLSLRALGSVVGLAVQVGLSLRSGPRGSTSLPSGTERPGTARGGRPASPAVGTPRPIAGHVVRPGGLAGLSLRARCSTSLPARTDPPWGGAAGVDHLARRDLGARRSRTPARA